MTLRCSLMFCNKSFVEFCRVLFSPSYTIVILFSLAAHFTFSVDYRRFRTLQRYCFCLFVCFSKHENVIVCSLFSLQALRWLPVQARIDYKLSTVCHNFFSDPSPAHLSDLLTVHTPSRYVRSSADTRILRITPC